MWPNPNCSSSACEEHGQCDCYTCCNRARHYKRVCQCVGLCHCGKTNVPPGNDTFNYHSLNPYALPCQGIDPHTNICHIKPLRPTCAVPVPNRYIYKFPHHLDIEGRFSCVPHPKNQTCCGHASSGLMDLATVPYPPWVPEESQLPGTDRVGYAGAQRENNEVSLTSMDRTPAFFDWESRNRSIEQARQNALYEKSWAHAGMESRLKNGTDNVYTYGQKTGPVNSRRDFQSLIRPRSVQEVSIGNPLEYGHNSFTNKPDCKKELAMLQSNGRVTSIRNWSGVATANY